jgi:hypothetical protein
MTFTDKQQKELRAAFIQESNQKAWSAAYHADSISKQLDKVLAEYTKLKEEDARLEGEIKTPEIAVDSHTKDNRDKRKSSQEGRNRLAKQMQAVGQSHAEGQQVLAGLTAPSRRGILGRSSFRTRPQIWSSMQRNRTRLKCSETP